MKILIVIGLGLVATVAPLVAQGNPESKQDYPERGGPPRKKQGKMHGSGGADLTPDERQRLDAAREKASADPTVRSLSEAKKSLEEQLANAMRAAMVAADPSLLPTLDKIKESRDRAKEMRDNFQSLTPEQKQQLKAARSAAKEDPAVQAAGEKIRDAEGHDAKRQAARAMHEAMKAAILKADPGLAPLLEKLGPGGPHGGGPDGASAAMEEPPGAPGSE